MLAFMENILGEFRKCFSRTAAFKWFAVIIVAMIVRPDLLGVTSIIRALDLSPGWYESLLHFFRSSSYRLGEMRNIWYHVVLRNAPLYKCHNRVILVGDGVKQGKEARKMPGVKKMAQESETCSKPEYIHGHLFGSLGVVIGTARKKYCLPLKINIQDGLKSAAGWPENKGIIDISDKSHVEQIVEAAFEAARVLGQSYVLLDRYFLTKPALRLMSQLNGTTEKEQGLVEIITKAKKNCNAYYKPLPKSPGKKGRPALKGKTIKVSHLFRQKQRFTKAEAYLYGKKETVSYYCVNLLWGQGLYQELRFVLVEFDGTQSILVSTDLTLKPVKIIELYGKRFSTEGMFREMKQQFGAFGYHFWTASLPKLSHFFKKEERDVLAGITNPEYRIRVLKTIKAIESFVLFASIAIGITQMISLNEAYAAEVTRVRYLRTFSSSVPSEGTVRHYFRQKLFLLLLKSPSSFITQYIYERQKGQKAEENLSETA